MTVPFVAPRAVQGETNTKNGGFTPLGQQNRGFLPTYLNLSARLTKVNTVSAPYRRGMPK